MTAAASTLLALLAVAVFALLLVRLTSRLPAPGPRPESQSLPFDPATRLGASVAPAIAAHPGLSGIAMLGDSFAAFAARVLLARAAERSLDIRYYVWRPDHAGYILLHELVLAARRGVRVRLLLDDNGIGGLDPALATIMRVPGIELRLFNPFVIRRPKPIGYLTDFSRLNRRMHNKSFAADSALAVIGGRNIGDEYFGAGSGELFADLDVVAAGPVVADLAADFDRYWDCASAWPAATFLAAVTPMGEAAIAARAAAAWKDPAAEGYVRAVAAVPSFGGAPDFHLGWYPVTMVSDDPAKGLGQAPPEDELGPRLFGMIGTPGRSLEIVSAYFVPGQTGTATFCALARGGVDVRVLTNSFDATNHKVVHSGYARRRQALLEAGVVLWEAKGPDAWDLPRQPMRLFGAHGAQRRVLVGSQTTALHAKTFAVDGTRLFVGSFNFDPRSVALNTEMGFLIDSPELAGQLSRLFDEGLRERAYAVRLAPGRRRLEWLEWTPEGTIVHHAEPAMRPGTRLLMRLLVLLPIEWLL